MRALPCNSLGLLKLNYLFKICQVAKLGHNKRRGLVSFQILTRLASPTLFTVFASGTKVV